MCDQTASHLGSESSNRPASHVSLQASQCSGVFDEYTLHSELSAELPVVRPVSTQSQVLSFGDVSKLSDRGDRLPGGGAQTRYGEATLLSHVAKADELCLEPFLLRHSISAAAYWW